MSLSCYAEIRDLLVTLPERLREERTRRGVGAVEIASALDLSPVELWKIEHRQTAPDLDLVIRMIDWLHGPEGSTYAFFDGDET